MAKKKLIEKIEGSDIKLTKSQETAIRKAYVKNKARIDKGFKKEDSLEYFVEEVKERMADNINKGATQSEAVKKSINRTLRMQEFMSPSERLHGQIMDLIRSDDEAYEKWRKYNQHQKINMDNFRALGMGTYVYVMKNYMVVIDYDFSPESVSVRKEML